jgi:hypothetical protein
MPGFSAGRGESRERAPKILNLARVPVLPLSQPFGLGVHLPEGFLLLRDGPAPAAAKSQAQSRAKVTSIREVFIGPTAGKTPPTPVDFRFVEP